MALERENAKKKGKVLLNAFKSLPPPFAIVDHLIFLGRRATISSLKEFYGTMFVPMSDDDEFGGQISIPEMKLIYERYCFLHLLIEKPL